ncbi:MAG: hypothetical protein ACRYG2_30580, partial [Janthinobacterium lividum]
GLPAQRQVVDAFFAAARGGRLADLVAVLHDDVVFRGDDGHGLRTVLGADAVGRQARSYAGDERQVHAAVVDGAAGAVVVMGGLPVSVMAFTVVAGRIATIDALTDPARISLDLTWLLG